MCPCCINLMPPKKKGYKPAPHLMVYSNDVTTRYGHVPVVQK